MEHLIGLIVVLAWLGWRKYRKQNIIVSDFVMSTSIICSTDLTGLCIGLLVSLWANNQEFGKQIVHKWQQ